MTQDRKGRCLIVGGHATRRRALVHWLREEGFEAREVASAAEALRLLPDFVPDAALVDAAVGSALAEVLRAVRARGPHTHAWVTRDRPTDAADAVEWADGFFDRPMNLFELRRSLEQAGHRNTKDRNDGTL